MLKKTAVSMTEALEADTLKMGPDVASRDVKACAGFEVGASLGETKVATLGPCIRGDMVARQAELLWDIPGSQVGMVHEAAHVPTVEKTARLNDGVEGFVGGPRPCFVDRGKGEVIN